jgi:hypothetical protein
MLTDVTPQIEDTKTILPAPEAFKSGCASWDKWKADWRFVFIINEKSSAVYSKVGLYTLVPALLIYLFINTKLVIIAHTDIEDKFFKYMLTRMLSFPPKREETSFISLSRSAWEDTSQTDPLTLRPLSFH